MDRVSWAGFLGDVGLLGVEVEELLDFEGLVEEGLVLVIESFPLEELA